MSRNPVIGYVGLTHLGINSAAAAASKGFQIVAFDPDEALARRLGQGDLPVVEPGLDSLIEKNQARLRFTSDLERLEECDVVYISPDVPTDDEGNSDLDAVMALLTLTGPALRTDAVTVVLSQVPPGFMRSLGRSSEKTFCQVETLVFGRAVERATQPERFIIGCADPGVALPENLTAFLEAFACPILPMRYESAELAKISINCCLVASVSVANTLAELCEKIGADWSEIAPALKLDKRIGQHAYLSPGLGISGGNLERDLATVTRIGNSVGSDSGIVSAFQNNSRHRRNWALNRLHQSIDVSAPGTHIGLLGLAYKENTHSVKNSPAIALLSSLTPFTVSAYDPVVGIDSQWHPALSQVPTALDACAGANAIMIMTPWPEFREIEPADIKDRLEGRVVIDPFACLPLEQCRSVGLDHFVLGRDTGI